MSSMAENDVKKSPELRVIEILELTQSPKKADEEEELRRDSTEILQKKSDTDSLTLTQTKSDANEWRITRYLPKGLRRGGAHKKGDSCFKYVRLDCSQLKTCTACSQLVIFSTSVVIILILVLSGCLSNKNRKQDSNTPLLQLFQRLIPGSNITIDSSTTVTKSTISSNETFGSTVTVGTTQTMSWSPTNETTTATPKAGIKCLAEYYFVMICIIAANFEIFTIFFYLYHFVEALPGIPWLTIEIVYYPLWGLQYLIMSIWMSVYGGWHIFTTFLGFTDSVLFFILGSIKYKRKKEGKPAQNRSDDPDGNAFRKLSPNLKFTKSVEQLDDKRQSLKKSSLDSL